MHASNKLDQYLEAFRARLRKLTLLQGAAATTAVLLVVSTIGAWFSAESGFASTTTNVFRVLLVLSLAAVIVKFLVDPLRRIKQGISSQVETRVPGFDGRIETYTQMQASNNPFIDLLAEDALKISAVNPVEERVSKQELNKAGGLLAAFAVVMLYLLIAGPGFLNYSMRNLLAGWAFNDLLPPQSIEVTPGDQSVRRGANVRITSVMQGFDPDEAVINIRNADGEWQEVAMVESPLGFEFTFFSMQQGMSYYISSTGLRSPEYAISVVDVPGIENLSLTYNYPEWTERDPETFTEGDINTLADTRVQLTVTTTAPLTEGQLVLNSDKQGMSLNGNQATTEFTVLEEGEYYIAAIVGGEEVRLSDDYFIRITEDGKPVIEVARPGGDYNASNIEEVLARIEAKDDYNLQTVALQYSVNGGDFQKIELAAGERNITADHMFMLEEMTTTATQEVVTNVGQFNIVLDEEPADAPATEPAPQDGAPAIVDQRTVAVTYDQIPLQPGDIISYYAEASDRSNTVRTDMYFIQIQPYNRRYAQSQMSGGGGGGGGGGSPEEEISQRQRQIIVSAWNLIREQTESENATQVEINSKLLSDLQKTLAEQAATLTERVRARQLDGDPQIAEFVNNMDAAVQSMYPASERFAVVELNDAMKPAQEALQHLLRAESVFNDITIQQQQGGGGGGGGRAGEDLAEMFELEMDRELNQYETGGNVSPQARQQEAEDIMKQLDELAKRQQQLADNLRNQQQMTDAQRYQQEMLRREAEQLQERLEQLQRQRSGQQGQQQANNQQGQQGQEGQQGQQGQQGQPGQPGQGGQGGQQGQQQAGADGQQQGEQQGQEGQEGQAGEQVAQSELQRRMESAIRAMNEAAEGMRGNLSPEELQRAAEEARRQLEGASEQIAQDQLAGMQQTFENMANLSEEMVRAQEGMEQKLQEATQTAVRERESGDNPNSRGMTLQEESELAQEKQQLAAQLRNLQQDMLDAMQNFRTQVPAASNELERANDAIAESELEQAVADAALYIDAGYGLYIAGNESTVTAGMRELAERLERAQQLAAEAGASGATDLDRARQQAQDLRAQLQQLAQGGQPGQGQQASDQPAQPGQEGQPGQGQQQGQQQGGAQQGGQNNGGGGERFGGFGGRNGPWNGDDYYNGPIELPEDFYDNVRQFTQDARNAVRDLELNNEELTNMYDLIRELEFQQTNRNDTILAQEYGEMLALIEQLEAGLQIDSDANGRSNVRTATSDNIPEQYKESVAEYFRRLSRQE